MHAVKGLEFDNVFVIGMEEGIFPHYNAINEGGMAAIEEERRLAYQDLDKAVILCLETKIKKLTSEGKPIHQDTIKTLNYFKEKSI